MAEGEDQYAILRRLVTIERDITAVAEWDDQLTQVGIGRHRTTDARMLGKPRQSLTDRGCRVL